MKRLEKVSGFLLAVFCALIIRYANSEVVGLEPIVVSPFAQLEGTSIYNVPSSIHSYSEEEIENSGASSLLEFLAKIPNFNVSDWYGTGVKANVDLVGFGESAGSNILLLINGRRVNDIDMSGIDWTQVALENIERIEVLKGSGIVLYGDNASGGVINIITKKPSRGKLSGSVNVKFGSYSLDNENIEAKEANDIFSIYVNGGHYGTQGYRENSFYYSDDVSSYFNFTPQEYTNIFLELGYHNYRYGLPGALYDTDIETNYTRRDTKYPNDYAYMEDSYVQLGLEQELSADMKIQVISNFRNKNGKDNWLSSGIYSIDKNIQNGSVKMQLQFKYDIFKMGHNLIAGTEFYKANFSADKDYPIDGPWSIDDWTDIDRQTRAFFMQDEIRLVDKLSLLIGFRRQKEEFNFDYTPRTGSVIDDNLDFMEEAYEVGLNYLWREKTNTFLHFTRGFRVPKTDEYFDTFATPPINSEMVPQHSRMITAGLNSQINNKIAFNWDAFYASIDNELYYNVNYVWPGYGNQNYPKTRRVGFNVGTTVKPFDSFALNLNYTYTDAEYRKGDYKGKRFPMVPEHLFKANATYSFFDKFTLYCDLLYRDSVYQINDPNNIYKKLNSYWVANLKLNYSYKNKWDIYCGINNLFNEKYSEYGAYSTVYNKNGLYPSPEINYYMGLKHTF